MTADNARTEDATRAVHQALNCDRGEYDDHAGGGHACFEHETDLDSDGHCPVAKTIAQTLADAGLLANPHHPKGPIMSTPIERGAEAIAGEYDRRGHLKPGTWWSAPHRRAGLRMEARAVLEAALDREGLIDVLVMSPLSDFAGTDMRPIERTADAIIAWLLSEGGES